VLEGLAAVLRHGDMADMAIEDLRRWKEWDLTNEVLRLYGQKGYTSPLMVGTLARYAFACPRPEAARFREELRRKEPALYQDLLDEEKGPGGLGKTSMEGPPRGRSGADLLAHGFWSLRAVLLSYPCRNALPPNTRVLGLVQP
jgi:hypothetical protein